MPDAINLANKAIKLARRARRETKVNRKRTINLWMYIIKLIKTKVNEKNT